MKVRNIIYADEGMVLTNGTEYGRIIYLAEGVSADNYYEITNSEYEEILAEQEAKSLADLGITP